jgi:imidazoleglycerol-phosphate dehydratase
MSTALRLRGEKGATPYRLEYLWKGAIMRTADISRQTNETQIQIKLNLDGTGEHKISTGVGFLDHMLTHLAVHGLFDLTVQATGDLHIDVHHTVEDVALALGQAFDQALGDRKGIVRMGNFFTPMDETLAHVAVDLSGRPYAVIQAEWHTPYVGNIPTTLFPHFFESFAVTARCNLHARVLYGRDDHHQAEALFKAWARALDVATQLDPRRAGNVPSTKGTL